LQVAPAFSRSSATAAAAADAPAPPAADDATAPAARQSRAERRRVAAGRFGAQLAQLRNVTLDEGSARFLENEERRAACESRGGSAGGGLGPAAASRPPFPFPLLPRRPVRTS
jgi:hypothetical protein